MVASPCSTVKRQRGECGHVHSHTRKHLPTQPATAKKSNTQYKTTTECHITIIENAMCTYVYCVKTMCTCTCTCIYACQCIYLYMYIHDCTCNSCLTVIVVDEMHGRMHHNHSQITNLLAHDPPSSLAYPMMPHPSPSQQLAYKTLVARQQPTSTCRCTVQVHTRTQ